MSASCICDQWFGMNLSCPTHGVHRTSSSRPLPTEATHGMAEQDSVATYRMGQLADALREAGFLVGDGEYDLIIRYATKCIQETGKWTLTRHAT